MTKRTRSPNRTVDQILAEQLAKVEALQQRAALESAKMNPVLTPLLEKIKYTQTALINDSKLLGEGPQSTHTRRRSHELWINVIDAEERKAELSVDYLKRQRDGYNDLLSTLSTLIAEDKDVTDEQVQDMIQEMTLDNSQELSEATDTLERTIAERENHTAQKAAKKRVSTTISVEG